MLGDAEWGVFHGCGPGPGGGCWGGSLTGCGGGGWERRGGLSHRGASLAPRGRVGLEKGRQPCWDFALPLITEHARRVGCWP